jgi:hypothetical protein
MEGLIAGLGVAAGAGWGVAAGLAVALWVALTLLARPSPPDRALQLGAPQYEGDVEEFPSFGQRRTGT